MVGILLSFTCMCGLDVCIKTIGLWIILITGKTFIGKTYTKKSYRREILFRLLSSSVENYLTPLMMNNFRFQSRIVGCLASNMRLETTK